MPKKVIFAQVLNNLSKDYKSLSTNITQSIRSYPNSVTLENLFSNLIDESKRVIYREDKEKDSIALSTIKGKPYRV